MKTTRGKTISESSKTSQLEGNHDNLMCLCVHLKMVQTFTMVCVRLTGCANTSSNSFCAFFPAGGPHQPGQRDKHLHHPQRVSGMNVNGSQLLLSVCARQPLTASVDILPSSPQTYIKSMDKDFVAATIQAIGRCATNIGEVRDTCLNGLVQLLSNRDGESLLCPQQRRFSVLAVFQHTKQLFLGTRLIDSLVCLSCRCTELVVAESVVVIKKLLQMQPEKHSDIIKHMAKLTDNIQVGGKSKPAAVWCLGFDDLSKRQPRGKRQLAGVEFSDPSPGADGSSQHPVADWRILRARPQDRPGRAEKDGQVVHQRRGHRQAANHQSGRQALSHQLQTGADAVVFVRR